MLQTGGVKEGLTFTSHFRWQDSLQAERGETAEIRSRNGACDHSSTFYVSCFQSEQQAEVKPAGRKTRSVLWLTCGGAAPMWPQRANIQHVTGGEMFFFICIFRASLAGVGINDAH